MAEYLSEKEKTFSPKVQSYLEGTRKLADAKGGGGDFMNRNQDIKDTDGSELTANEVRSRISAYQTSTARRSKTDERMTDFENYSNQEDVQTDFGKDTTGGDTKKDTTGGDTGTDRDLDFGNASVKAQIEASQAEAESDIAYINNSLDRLSNQADGAYRRFVSATKDLYGARIDEMRKANDTLLKKQEQIGMRTGRQRYTPLMQQGILTAEEQAGAERISKLQAQLMYDLAEAEQGKQANDLKRFNDAYDKIEARKQQLNKEIADLYKAATDQNEALRKERSEQRLLEKQEYEQNIKTAEQSAPFIAQTFSEFTTGEEQADFLKKTADYLGIEPMALGGMIVEASEDSMKAKADLDRVIQLEATGWASNRRDQEAHDDEKVWVGGELVSPQAGRRILRSEIIKQLEKDNDVDKARESWATLFPVDEFDKEFASYIEE